MRARTIVSWVLLLGISALSEAIAGSPPADLEKLLKSMDAVRNPAESYLMAVRVTSSDADGVALYDVAVSGNSRTLITQKEPPLSVGKKYLMLDEDIWAFTPHMGRPVRASLSEKLTGQASNGDISRMRWSGDYAPKLEKQGGGTAVLMLTAKKKNLTYDKIRVWVSLKDSHPLKAEFLTLAGAVFKRAAYGGYRSMAGKVRPTQITIEDAKVRTDRSVIQILSMKPQSFPESIFNQNSLK